MTKALLLVIDGCRVDTLQSACTPHLDALMDRGTWTLDARTVSPSLTLPVHFSIFSSRSPASHGVLSNAVPGSAEPPVTGYVQWVKSFQKTTAMYYNWEFLGELSPPGCLDQGIFLNTNQDQGGDMQIARVAAENMVKTAPDFAFVYLGCLDEIGHSSGFASSDYQQALELADTAVGHLFSALEKAGLLNEYTILFQSDHGGAGHHHTDTLPEVMTVPWVLAGPGIRSKEIRLSNDAPGRGRITILDSIPTLSFCMRIPMHQAWEGRVITEAFAP